MSEVDELIHAGNPLHPCDVCGKRSTALHVKPCLPVTREQAIERVEDRLAGMRTKEAPSVYLVENIARNEALLKALRA